MYGRGRGVPLLAGSVPVGGAAASVCGSASGAMPASGAASLGGRPCWGFCPWEQRPQAPLPCGAIARAAAPRRLCPGAQRPQAPLPAGCEPRRRQACCKQTAGRLLQAQRLRMRRRCAACLRLRCTHADRGQQLLLPFLVFASTILTSKFFLNITHAVQNQSFARTTWL